MYKKIASNTISQILTKALTAIISIFLISLLTNFLTVEMYWLYNKIYNYTWIFVFLADLWLYAITIREITTNKENTAKIVWNVMTLRFILWVWILLFSIIIAYFLPWYNSPLVLFCIFISSIFTIIQLLNSSIMALMQAEMKIEFSLISTVLGKLLNIWLIALIIYFVFWMWYYTWVTSINITDNIPFVLIFVISTIWIFANTFLNYFYARKIVKFWFDFDWEYIKHLFKISLPYWVALFLSIIYFKVDVILLSLLEWPWNWDLSIALYSLPMKIVEVIMVVWGFYMTSMLPSLTKAFKEEDKTSLNHLIGISFKVLFAFSIFIFSLWILFREYIIEIVANRNYLETTHMFNSSDAFLVVFAVVVFYFISLVFIYSLVASENQNKLLKINIIVTIFNIIWNIILIPKFSFIWAWIITLCSQILLLVLGFIATRKLIKFHLPFNFALKNILFWTFIYFLWNFLITNYSFGLYIDFVLYSAILVSMYLVFLFFTFKKLIWVVK